MAMAVLDVSLEAQHRDWLLTGKSGELSQRLVAIGCRQMLAKQPPALPATGC